LGRDGRRIRRILRLAIGRKEALWAEMGEESAGFFDVLYPVRIRYGGIFEGTCKRNRSPRTYHPKI
jgi:hypothetical protein